MPRPLIVRYLVLLCAVSTLLWVTPLPALAGTAADPEQFFKRLESIGLSTDGLRKITSKIELFYKSPSSTAEASYGYILDNLYIPWEFKEKDSNRIRFDLQPNELNTLLHEYTHAANDVTCNDQAARGTLEREHADAVTFIRADVMLDKRNQNFLGLCRYPRFRADEVTGYFMGKCIMDLFFAVGDLVLYNTVMTEKYMTRPEDAEELGSRLVLPPEDTKDGFSQRLLRYKFGSGSASDIAEFEGKTVHWDDQNRAWLKERMWKYLLGLEPPTTIRELCDRLNGLDNDWIAGVRKQLLAERQKEARNLAAKAQRDPAREDPLAGARELNQR